jgi:hypothetical protein
MEIISKKQIRTLFAIFFIVFLLLLLSACEKVPMCNEQARTQAQVEYFETINDLEARYLNGQISYKYYETALNGALTTYNNNLKKANCE